MRKNLSTRIVNKTTRTGKIIQYCQAIRKATRRTPFESKLKVLEFWHCREFITESTLSSNPAHLRVGNRPAIQSGLQFKVPVTEQMLRNRPFHEAQWLIFDRPLRELYLQYTKKNPKSLRFFWCLVFIEAM